MNAISFTFFVISSSTQSAHGDDDPLRKLYPLISPVLGNISLECKNASYRYINNLSAALKAKG